jgi:heterodisulfide reductase subunit D
MHDMSFEAVLRDDVDRMIDACTTCGKCVEVCPSAAPAGVTDSPAKDIVAGVLDIVRTGDGPAASRTWASACMLSGDCITACDDGVNPRVLLAMARLAMLRHDQDLSERRRQGVQKFRAMSTDVNVLSQMQLDRAVLERLGQGAASVSRPAAAPDFVFHTGCNVLKTPHIALLALDIMDRLGISYRVMGGPSHCCGIVHLRAGDLDMSGRMGTSTVDKFTQAASGHVLSWCPSCFVQFTETTLPAIEKQRGSRPFEITPFLRFLRERLADMIPHFRHPVALKVALHGHPGVPGVMAAAADILCAVPGIELVDLNQPAVGLQSVNLGVLPAYKRELQLQELEAAAAAGVDALVTMYHSDQRELCAHERDWPFRILNILDVVGASMGLHWHDRFKELKMTQDVDLILTECAGTIAAHGIDPESARDIVVRAMLGDQPLPLRGGGGAGHL